MVSLRSLFIALMSRVFCWTVPAHAYVDLVPTLAKVITDSKKIAVVEVVEFNRERHVVVLKETRLLKGEGSAEPIQHDVRPAEARQSRDRSSNGSAPWCGASSSSRGTRPWSVSAAVGIRRGHPGHPVRRAAGRGRSARTARSCPWPITDPCPGWPIALP